MSVFQIDLKADIYGKNYETITADGYRVDVSGAVTFYELEKKGGGEDIEWEDEENIRSFPPGSWLDVKRT